jgi:hypothetical protein
MPASRSRVSCGTVSPEGRAKRYAQILRQAGGLRSAAESNHADGEIGVEDGANSEARRRRCRPSNGSVSRWSSMRSNGLISRTQDRQGTLPERLATGERRYAAAACGKSAPSLSKCMVCDGAPSLFSLPNGMTWAGQFLQMAAAALSRPRPFAQGGALEPFSGHPDPKRSPTGAPCGRSWHFRVAVVLRGTAVAIGNTLEFLGNGSHCAAMPRTANRPRGGGISL